MGVRVVWAYICSIAAVYLHFISDKSVVVSRAQLFLAAQAFIGFGQLLDSNVVPLPFLAEMAQCFVIIRMHFAFFIWSR